jgi:hypothetical protein
LLIEPLREFFELARLGLKDFLLIGGITVVWAVSLRYIWRTNLFERLLGITNAPDTLDLAE